MENLKTITCEMSDEEILDTLYDDISGEWEGTIDPNEIVVKAKAIMDEDGIQYPVEVLFHIWVEGYYTEWSECEDGFRQYYSELDTDAVFENLQQLLTEVEVNEVKPIKK